MEMPWRRTSPNSQRESISSLSLPQSTKVTPAFFFKSAAPVFLPALTNRSTVEGQGLEQYALKKFSQSRSAG